MTRRHDHLLSVQVWHPALRETLGNDGWTPGLGIAAYPKPDDQASVSPALALKQGHPKAVSGGRLAIQMRWTATLKSLTTEA